MLVLRGLLFGPRHIRDLAAQYSISPAGVADILRRLKRAGILTARPSGNRRYFSLRLPPDELDCLKSFFSIYEKRALEERTARFSRCAAEKMKWMDEAYQFFRGVKHLRHDPS